MGKLVIKRQYKRMLFIFVSALFSTLALTMKLSNHSVASICENMNIETTSRSLLWYLQVFLGDLTMSMRGYSLIACIVFGMFLYLYSHHAVKKEKRLVYCAMIPALLFSFFMVFGKSYMETSSWNYIFANARTLLKASIVAIGYVILFYQGIAIAFVKLKTLKVKRTKKDSLTWFTDNKKSIFIVAGIILLLWLPHLISCFPGLTNYDFFDMIDSFYGHETYSLRAVTLLSPEVTLNNNNPVLQTLMAVGFLQLGNLLGSPIIGLVLFCYGQAICFALVLSYVIYYLAKLGVRKRYRVALLLLYGLVPLNANYAITTLKDTNFAFIFILYILCMVDILRLKEDYFKSHKRIWYFGGLSLLLMLLRNNGLYVIAINAVIFLIVYRKYWRRIVLPILLPIVIYQVVIVSMLFPYLKIAPGSKREAYSIPFQQTARLVKEHGDEIGEEDRQIIDKVLKYDTIAKRYDPELSDKVKATYKKDCTKEEFNAYLEVWAKWLFIHPTVYVQATMNNYYGYFYPEAKSWLTYTEIAETGLPYGLKSPTSLRSLRWISTNSPYVFRQIPGLGFLESIGFYTWILILTVSYLLYHKRREAIMMMSPVLILLLTCIAGPANMMMRYIYPMMLLVPFYCIVSLYVVHHGKEA